MSPSALICDCFSAAHPDSQRRPCYAADPDRRGSGGGKPELGSAPVGSKAAVSPEAVPAKTEWTMKHGIIRVLAVAILGLSDTAVGDQHSAAIQQGASPEVEVSASKKELLQHMKKLEERLPSELRRKLIVISMKLATGWCSPYAAREFEDEIDKLPAQERKTFEKEWKLVREHEAWPRLPPGKKAVSGSRSE